MHEEVMNGGVMKVTMGNEPDEQFGNKVIDRPKQVYK
jgi:hypothetical protein